MGLILKRHRWLNIQLVVMRIVETIALKKTAMWTFPFVVANDFELFLEPHFYLLYATWSIAVCLNFLTVIASFYFCWCHSPVLFTCIALTSAKVSSISYITEQQFCYLHHQFFLERNKSFSFLELIPCHKKSWAWLFPSLSVNDIQTFDFVPIRRRLLCEWRHD